VSTEKCIQKGKNREKKKKKKKEKKRKAKKRKKKTPKNPLTSQITRKHYCYNNKPTY